MQNHQILSASHRSKKTSQVKDTPERAPGLTGPHHSPAAGLIQSPARMCFAKLWFQPLLGRKRSKFDISLDNWCDAPPQTTAWAVCHINHRRTHTTSTPHLEQKKTCCNSCLETEHSALNHALPRICICQFERSAWQCAGRREGKLLRAFPGGTAERSRCRDRATHCRVAAAAAAPPGLCRPGLRLRSFTRGVILHIPHHKCWSSQRPRTSQRNNAACWHPNCTAVGLNQYSRMHVCRMTAHRDLKTDSPVSSANCWSRVKQNTPGHPVAAGTAQWGPEW